jgi:hypothetical protein
MARPIVGDVRIKQERRHLNNGKVYVYERVVKYDPETRRNITLQRKLLGIEDPETGKIIPTANYPLLRSVFLFSTDQFSTLSRSSDLLYSDH